jgi:hypothetical protein
MTTRRFVLEPAVEIAADFPHPLAGCSLAALLANISVPHPLVAVVGVPGSGAAEIAAAVADAVMARPLHAAHPLPCGVANHPQAWRDVVSAWTRSLAEADWTADPHGTVIDFWLDMIPAAAADCLPAAESARLEADVAHMAADVPVPQVAILLVAEAAVLEERNSARGRRATAGMRFVDPGGATATLSPPAPTAVLVQLQERIIRRLRGPGPRSTRAPKAVVVVDAGDLGRAAEEAIAAVEAMV